MSVELATHPDDSLDRAAASQYLAPNERAFLAQHLHDCRVCTFLQTVASDLSSEDAVNAERATAAALVASTLAALSRHALVEGPPLASSWSWSRAAEPLAAGRTTPARAQARPAVSRGAIRAVLWIAAVVALSFGGLGLASHWQRARDRRTQELAVPHARADVATTRH